MATFERVNPGSDLNSGNLFFITDHDGEQVQLSQLEAKELMRWLRSFLEPLPSLHEQHKREKARQQVIEALFEIAPQGPTKNSLWRKYQQLQRESEDAR